MPAHSVALMIYGEPSSNKSVFTEDKYKKLATQFVEKGFEVASICYHDSIADKLSKELIQYHALLVWVNPIEQQGDRKKLDNLLQGYQYRVFLFPLTRMLFYILALRKFYTKQKTRNLAQV